MEKERLARIMHRHRCELPAVRQDVQVVSLVAAFDEANAGDVVEGQQASLDDGALTRR